MVHNVIGFWRDTIGRTMGAPATCQFDKADKKRKKRPKKVAFKMGPDERILGRSERVAPETQAVQTRGPPPCV